MNSHEFIGIPFIGGSISCGSDCIKNETLNSYFIEFILYSTVDKAYDMYLNNFLRRQIRQK